MSPAWRSAAWFVAGVTVGTITALAVAGWDLDRTLQDAKRVIAEAERPRPPLSAYRERGKG